MTKAVDTSRHPSAGRTDRPLVVPARVRAWAKDQGLTVGQRGRVPQEIIAAYREDRRAS